MKKAYVFMKKHWWLQAIIIVITVATLVGAIYSYRPFDRENLRVVETTITDINVQEVSKQLKGQYKDKMITIYYTERPELSVLALINLTQTKVVEIKCEGNTILSIEDVNRSNTFRLLLYTAISTASFVIWLIVVIGAIRDILKRKNIAGVRLIEVSENGAYVVTKVLNPKLYTKIQNELSTMKKAKIVPELLPEKLPGVMFTYNNEDYEIQTFCYKRSYKYTESGLSETSVNTDYREDNFAWMVEKYSYMLDWYGPASN